MDWRSNQRRVGPGGAPGRERAAKLRAGRDKFFSADEAKAFGLVDKVFEKRPVPGEGDEAAVRAA